MAPNICDVVTEIRCITNSDSAKWHYFNLYLIFLVPLSFFSRFFFQLLLKYFQQQTPPPNLTITISLSLLLIIFSTIYTYAAIITITYSIFHGYFNRPVTLEEAIKSISTSLFPLLATNIVVYTVIFFISFLILLVPFLIIYLGYVDITTYPYLDMLCYIVLLLVFLPLVTFYAINLSFVHVIVVVESSWGFEPLRRSWKLVKGMKKLVLQTIFLFGFSQLLGLMTDYNNWILILSSSFMNAMFSFYIIAVITVLYIYSKEKHGEDANEEFGKEKDGAHLPLIG